MRSFILILLFLALTDSVRAQDGVGVVGTTCWTEVKVLKNGQNMCRNADKEFYPGILMAVA